MSTYTENKDNHYETKDSAQGKNHILLEIHWYHIPPHVRCYAKQLIPAYFKACYWQFRSVSITAVHTQQKAKKKGKNRCFGFCLVP